MEAFGASNSQAEMIGSVIVFGDSVGAPQALKHLPRDCVRGVVGASIRPGELEPLRSLSQRAGVPLLTQPKLKDPAWPDFFARMKSLQPDLLIVNSYAMLLPPELLKVASAGGVNVHWSPLPRYRGCHPIQWAIIHGESEGGVTLHRLSPNFDEGEILSQSRMPIELEDTWVTVHKKLFLASDALLKKTFPLLLKGKLVGTRQNSAEATYFPRRTPDEGRFDWGRSVMDIHNLIRALIPPLPAAFVMEESKKRFFDRYYTLNEITALKYSVPGQTLVRNAVRLAPLLSDPIDKAMMKELSMPARRMVTRGNQPTHSPILFSLRVLPDNSFAGVVGIEDLQLKEGSGTVVLLPVNRFARAADVIGEACALLTFFAFQELRLKQLVYAASMSVSFVESLQKMGFKKQKDRWVLTHV
jgi:methionyl-tRNA formyltransferase